jgi:hypothetical protein
MKRLLSLLLIVSVFLPFSLSCSSLNDAISLLLLLMNGKTGAAPVLNNLAISDSQADSIMLAQPTLSTAGDPTPTVRAYIGLNSTISVSGETVSGSVQGPIDVSADGCVFSGLNAGTTYKIIVVARNAVGYSVQQIVQSTDGIAPVLHSLSITTFDASSITIAQPTLSTAGNPTPTVQAYIGLNSTISVSGSTVSGSLQGPIDVSSAGYQFGGLNNGVSYKIIVVAQNSAGYSVEQIVQSTTGISIAPVLNSLSISTYDEASISLAKPTFSTAGNPPPTVQAYIGLNGTITVSGSTVSNSLQGPIDVSTGGYQFSSLTAGTAYKIFVVAKNSAGYSVQQIIQSTNGITAAPVLNSLSISAFDATSITLAKPTFSTAGSPTPTVQAYIGLNSTISVSGSTVTGSLQGPIDVSSGGYQFSGLTAVTSYKVIVVAKNLAGYSVMQIVQSTAGIAPALNSLSVSAFDMTSITIAKPTFSTAGNPTPTVKAYIGLSSTISVSGSTVSGSLQGPIDVSTGGYQFSSLSAVTSYKVIVIAANSAGYSVQQIVQSTAGIAPVLKSLSISTFDGSSISLAQPAFSTAGNPAPTVKAYIGLNSTISVSGSTVTGSLQGPIDVSTGGYQFSGLNALTAHKIIVVAQNTYGYSLQQIVQSTGVASGVYGAGFYTASGNSQACYWLNGTKYDLPGTAPSLLYGVAFGDNAIYLAGFYTLSGNTQACYWIVNASGTTKVDLPGTQPSRCSGIVKSGNMLYISGNDDFNLQQLKSGPCFWTVDLSTGTATRTGLWNTLGSIPLGAMTTGIVIASSGDIDISGGNVTNLGTSADAGYWKISGTTASWNPVKRIKSYAASMTIYASGSTLYLGGADEYDLSNVSTMRVAYWTISGTTNTEVNLESSNTGSYIAGIAYSGSTLYTSGQINTRTACYWKGSTRTDLPGASSSTYSAANGLYMTGSGNLYLSGYYNGSSVTDILGGTGGTACYWLAPAGANPVKTDLPGTAPASAVRIFVK